MSNNFSQINELREQVEQLMILHEEQRAENEKLREEKRALGKELEVKVFKISDLQKKYENLKIAKTITASSEDAHETKIKINRIVREIDRCIALLNK